jgi:hypothetical protein
MSPSRPQDDDHPQLHQGRPESLRFYESDTALASIVVKFLHDGFLAGERAIVLVTADHRALIIDHLTRRSCDVPALQHSGELSFVDVETALSWFMIDGKPNERAFRDHMFAVIRSVSQGRADCRLRLFGQGVDVLWRRGEREAAVRLEVLWNQLAETRVFSLRCAYAIGNFYKDAGFHDHASPST